MEQDSWNEYKEENHSQSAQLVKKSGLIVELTVARAQSQIQLQKLTDALTDASRKLETLQDENNLLLSNSGSEAHQRCLEVQALEQALEDVRVEQRAQRDKYETDVAGLKGALEEHRVMSDKRLQDKLSRQQKSHTEELCAARQGEQEKPAELEKVTIVQIGHSK